MKKRNLFVDALPLSTERISGVGHSLHGLISVLSSNETILNNYNVKLLTTRSGYKHLSSWGFKNVKYVKMPIPNRVANRIPTLALVPPLDILLGKGVYLFPNFRSWPLIWSFSITWVHDIGFLLHPQYVAPRNQKMLQKNINRWVRWSSMIATVSESSKAEIERNLLVNKDNILVVHNGVDEDDFSPVEETKYNLVLKKYGLPKNYFLYLGNIEPRKNIARLIRAYHQLPGEIKRNHPLVLVGGGGWLSDEIFEEMKKAISSGDKIVHPEEYVTDIDLPSIYSASCGLVHPAIYEGFGISPIQAMSCGVPVIVSNTSSLPEVVGDAGFYVDPLNEREITGAMKRMVEDKEARKALIEKGEERAKKFTWEAGSEELIEILKDKAKA